MPFPSKRHLSGKKNGSLRRCAEELRRAQQLHEQLPPRISCDVPSLIAVDRPAREPEARTMASHGWATAARLFSTRGRGSGGGLFSVHSSVSDPPPSMWCEQKCAPLPGSEVRASEAV